MHIQTLTISSLNISLCCICFIFSKFFYDYVATVASDSETEAESHDRNARNSRGMCLHDVFAHVLYFLSEFILSILCSNRRLPPE